MRKAKLGIIGGTGLGDLLLKDARGGMVHLIRALGMTSSLTIRESRISITLLAALLWAPVVVSTEPADPPVLDGRASVDDADIFLNDSFEAVDALSRARGLTQKGQWEEAAELLQGTADRLADKIVRVGPGEYIGLRAHINDLIAGWPPPGLEAYRALYERELDRHAALLVTPRDTVELVRLFDRYFCTARAAVLADAIGQSAVERADFSLAEYVYRRVIGRHPLRKDYRTQYAAMLEVIGAMRGDVAPVASGAPPSRIRWQGQDRALDDVLTEIRGGFSAFRAPQPSGQWPVFGGDLSRNRAPELLIDELGLLWRRPLRGPAETQEPSGDSGDDERKDHFSGRDLFVQPVAADGLIYIQIGRAVLALYGATGEIAWQFQIPQSPSESEDYIEERPPGWDAVTIHGGRVYASLPVEADAQTAYRSGAASHEIACLDATTGRLIWRGGPGESRFAEIHFDSSPLVAGGRVYVVGRRRRSFGFEDCYLYRLNADTGAIEAQTHLGSAATGGYSQHSATRTIVTMHGPSVFVSTNLGSIASVSPYTGMVQWLRLYERQRGDTGDPANHYRYGANAWQFNPILFDAGRLVALPTDAGSVLVLDAVSGNLIRTIPTESLGGAEALLGARGDRICTVGRDAACYDLGAEAVLWSAPLPDGAQLAGRGLWIRDRLAIPTTRGVSVFSVADASRQDLPWDAEGEGGNLVALEDKWLVASPRTLSAYARRADVWKVLKEKLEHLPADPAPALDLAEVALRGGEYDEAMSALKEAVRRARESASLETELRSRIFRDVITFAQTLVNRSKLDEALLDTLFEYASDHAAEMADHLTYRIRFADLHERLKRPDQSVKLLQQILQDRSLRDLPVESRQSGGQRAALFAQARITELIERFGAEVYAPYELQAGRWLQTGASGPDDALLVRIVEVYPNSEAAPKALVARGDLLAAQNLANDSARCFAQAYQRYPQAVERPSLLRKIADAYERAGNREYAYLWLTKASREHPTALLEQDGRSMTFAQYRERLADIRGRVEPRRPNIELPLDHRYTQALDGGDLLTPRYPDESGQDWSTFFAAEPAGVMAYNPRSGRRLWERPSPVTAIPDLLLAGKNLAIFMTATSVFALNVQDGLRVWEVGATKGVNDQGDDWEEGQTIRAHTLRGDRLVVVRDNALMSAIDLVDGRVLWSASQRPAPQGRIRLNDRWVVYSVLQDGRALIGLVDLNTGQPVEVMATDEKRPVEELFITLDDQIVIVTTRSIAAYAAQSRAERWKINLSGQIRRASILLDLDALYFSNDSGDLIKISLEDGRTLWQTEKLLARYTDDVTLMREGASLILSTSSAIVAVDPVNGMLLWRGTAPPDAKLTVRLPTRSYVAALNLAGKAPNDDVDTVFFYDHRNASGVLPAGGAPTIGPLEDIRAVLAVDGAFLIQAGAVLHALSQGE